MPASLEPERGFCYRSKQINANMAKCLLCMIFCLTWIHDRCTDPFYL